MQPTYIYKRPFAQDITCYGKLKEDSNIDIICENEYGDVILCDNESKTWAAVCAYQLHNYRDDIIVMVAC